MTSSTVPERDRWNYNTHYYRLTDSAASGDARTALDVGCGEGMLARRLRLTVPRVTGIDPDPSSIEAARAVSEDIDYICGDLFEHPFEPESFDVVASFAALHHMDARRGLSRLAELVRPGGTLVVVSCARSEFPRDLVMEGVSFVAAHIQIRRHTMWDHESPVVWPPPASYREMRKLSAELLPGSHFRRHLLFRYSIVWRKPNSVI
ncbi:methyltransferase type 11 [Williamsia sp. Leaf354]|uniref:class I SAM-dependent methyltransferase n=1 Tax=Williamsia sp. Leaf354 TaxID=1736349 RepID=UPI000701DF42|nr:class I SAM-dependent methyltransferase [Williamsia sp. Leaf354]KQS00417.1 methyltransferase type 11 [Williamsia sp. Leaf354]